MGRISSSALEPWEKAGVRGIRTAVTAAPIHQALPEADRVSAIRPARYKNHP